MKAAQVLLCLALVLCLASVTMSMIVNGILPGLGWASAGAGVAIIAMSGVYIRERRLRKFIVAAYQADAPHTRAGDIVRVLGTPDIVQARTDYLKREDVRRASLYANGDASDY